MSSFLSSLEAWGFNPYFQALFSEYADQGLQPARVLAEYTHTYRLQTSLGEVQAEVTGKYRHLTQSREDYPAVGDWVVISQEEGTTRIHETLSRLSCFRRQVSSSKGDVQILAANVNTLFLVMGLNQDFNLRRLERYLSLAWDSRTRAVILLNKQDLCADSESMLQSVIQLAADTPVHRLSALYHEGLQALEPYLLPGQTLAVLGSSGAGKSTLINALMGNPLMETNGVRKGDQKGKHTTTHRQLLKLPQGALLIDTPGMRELQLWDASEGIGQTFAELEELALSCRFRDCNHEQEIGCAIQAAVQSGELDSGRLANFRKLSREDAHHKRKHSHLAQIEEKKRWKQIHKNLRQRYRSQSLEF
jgi:ribosome biogenesis GTPase / thiamine phosphate phosphatase